MKHTLPALTYAFDKLRIVGDVKQDMIAVALKSSLEIDRILDEHPTTFRLPPEASRSFIANGLLFLNKYTALAEAYNHAGEMVFNTTVKCHMLCHIVLRADDLNPRRSWCFSGERMMLIMRRLCQSCVRGIKMADLGQKALSKHRHGLYLTMVDAGEWMSEEDLEL